jgi:choice-of-anchor A domain-containing protein
VDEYNLYSLSGVYGCNSDVEGRVAANGDVVLSSYSIGLKLQASTQNSLVSSGNVDWNHGTVWHGGIVADTVTANNVGIIVDGTTYPSTCCTNNGCGYCSSEGSSTSPFNFETAQSYLYELSLLWFGLESTPGAIINHSFSTLTLTAASGAEYSVFNGVSLDDVSTINIHGSASQTILVNFASSVDTFANLGISLSGGITDNRIVYQFSAEVVSISGIGVLGTVFAPFSDINFPNGVVEGNVIAASFGSPYSCNTGQINLVPFEGCLPVPNPPLICCLYTRNDNQFTNGFCTDSSCPPINGWTVAPYPVQNCLECACP